ncbi:MAG: hypothetical protein JWQ84_363 [Mucilaginibacter sp.]|nr:hypothetical protein [Mucilaginibacter sp.]MDB5015531.1 hypothetical protein [Mucilaginibacter sp.]MDB5138334.1 hypothetical protein [Mucilaginibacter sp.]
MKKHLIMLSILLLTVIISQAQDTVLQKKEIKTPQTDSLIKIIPEGRHFLYTVGGKLQTPDEIKYRLLNYAPSAVELNAAIKNMTWSFVSLGGAAVTSGLAGYEYYNNSKKPVANVAWVNGKPGFVYTYPHNDKTGAYILTGAAIGFLAAEIITLVKASNHDKKAFWLYNLQFQ